MISMELASDYRDKDIRMHNVLRDATQPDHRDEAHRRIHENKASFTLQDSRRQPKPISRITLSRPEVKRVLMRMELIDRHALQDWRF
ncbi:unnamed protein product [Caenorhabditis sp. 36 PRJEB53466]|nr:unnamed protein product [Caenorhabditis sp. 36 PRJEB53466]